MQPEYKRYTEYSTEVQGHSNTRRDEKWWGFCWHARHLTHDGGLLRYMAHPHGPSGVLLTPFVSDHIKHFCLPLFPMMENIYI